MRLKFIWKKKTGEYDNGEDLYLNTIRIAGYSWHISGEVKWQGSINLPLLNTEDSFVSDNDTTTLRAKIENIVTNWFTEALKPNQ